MFKDRRDAALKLLPFLEKFKNKKDAVVLALPRGGVVLGYEIAKFLNLPLDIIVPRKIGAPFNPELAIGAICDDVVLLNDELIHDLGVAKEFISNQIAKEKKEADRRYLLYRQNKKPLNLENKWAIVVDDGIATGYTMLASIKALIARKAKKIIVVAPVAPPYVIEKIKKEVDEVICPYTFEDFFAIGEFYELFEQVEDEKVINFLNNI